MTEKKRTLLDDFDAMAYMADYYAEKIHAAVELARIRKLARLLIGGRRSHLETVLARWDDYTRVSEANYRPQMLARPGQLDWSARRLDAERYIRLAREYRPER